MVSTLIWRHVGLPYVVQSNILWLTITDVTPYVHHKFTVSFVLYIATKKLNQNITVNSSANTPIKQKNNSCTLCVPMFDIVSVNEITETKGT